MIKFYTNRELSQIFSINLAKWKRWSREFLPPDPLGGLQSGYARQYNLDEAFTVFLGGHLVGDLKFTIPESRQILADLNQWLLDHGFFFDFSGKANPEEGPARSAQNYQIAIMGAINASDAESGPAYRIKATLTTESVYFQGIPVQQERYLKSSIGIKQLDPQLNVKSYRVLDISQLRKSFLGFFKSE